MNNYWITWFPGALLAFAGIIALSYKGIRAFIRLTDAMPVLLDAAKELKTNGGASMKDDINHIRTKQAQQSEGAAKIARDLIGANKKIDGVAADLVKTNASINEHTAVEEAFQKTVTDTLQASKATMEHHIQADKEAFERIEKRLV